MQQVRVPPPPVTLGRVADTTIQADASAPFGVVGAVVLCWLLVTDRYQDHRMPVRAALTMLWTLLLFVVFFVHEIGHLITARKVNAPMDALLINGVHWITLYHDNTVSPDQHIGRAAGGPLANLLAFRMARVLRGLLPGGPFGRDLMDAFAGFNAAICAVSLLPAPSFDGGAMMRWAVFSQTGSLEQAAGQVRRAGLASSSLLGIIATLALAVGKRLWGTLFAAFSLVMALEALRRN